MSTTNSLICKPIGIVLQEADLINEGQIQVALREQTIYEHLRLGEIFALHGWISQKTADFFGETIKDLLTQEHKKRFGYYLFEADLISENDLDVILLEQRKTGIKLGSVAVLQGYIKQQTLDFFLKYFVGETSNKNYLRKQQRHHHSSAKKLSVHSFQDTSTIINKNKKAIGDQPTLIDKTTLIQETTIILNHDRKTEQSISDEDWEEIPWID